MLDPIVIASDYKLTIPDLNEDGDAINDAEMTAYLLEHESDLIFDPDSEDEDNIGDALAMIEMTPTGDDGIYVGVFPASVTETLIADNIYYLRIVATWEDATYTDTQATVSSRGACAI